MAGLIDDLGISCFVDNLAITSWVDDLGQTLTCAAAASTASPYTWKLSVDRSYGHGYDVGFWPGGADMTDPRQFVVVERWYDEPDAAGRSLQFNSGVTPPGPPWTVYTTTVPRPPFQGTPPEQRLQNN